MKQSRVMSLMESLANVVVGYGVAVVTQLVVFPLFGLHTTLAANLMMGAVFTLLCGAPHNSVYAECAVMRSLRRLGLAPQGFGDDVTPHNSGGWSLRRASPSACLAR